MQINTEKDPDNYLSYYKRATAYLSLGRNNAAVEDFSKILDLKPDFDQALIQRAKIYAKEGDFDLAKKDLEKYTKTHPKDAEAAALVSDWRLIQCCHVNLTQETHSCKQWRTQKSNLKKHKRQWRLDGSTNASSLLPASCRRHRNLPDFGWSEHSAILQREKLKKQLVIWRKQLVVHQRFYALEYWYRLLSL